MIKKILFYLLILLMLLIVVLVLNTIRLPSRQLEVPTIPTLPVDELGAATRLGEAVQLRTISSRDDANLNADQFKLYHALLQDKFPKVHNTLQREIVNDLSLLYTWKGRNPSAKPILLMGHLDVVPIAPDTEKDWLNDAFSGAIKDGFIWGRGTWDDKGNIMAQMEAIEMLIANGYQPERTILLAYGADEEVTGVRGATKIAAILKERHILIDFVLDEGLLITEGLLPGLDKPAALIGIAEKGYLSIELEITAPPGHSSMPPSKGQSAIGLLSAALTQIDNHQTPGKIEGVAKEMFTTIAPEMHGFARIALSNLWLFSPFIQQQLEAGAGTNATIRTTTAFTIINAGNKENVLPGQAKATINFRLKPGDTQEKVIAHIKEQVTKVIGNGQFNLTVLPGAVEPSKISPTDSASYTLINRTIREVFPKTLVTPGLVIGATDSVKYEELSEHIFKFSPVHVYPEDLNRFHGTNERMSIANFANMIRFYHRLISEGAKSDSIHQK